MSPVQSFPQIDEPKTPKGRPVGKEFLYLSPSVIAVEEGLNVRFEVSEVEKMLDSILEYGIQVPLHVRAEGALYIVEGGHRRLAAVKLGISRGIGSPHLKLLPCRIVTPLANEADRLLLQLVRNSGAPLTPLEQVTAIEKLEKMGMTRDEILKKWGVSEQTMRNAEALRNAPEFIQEWIRAGRMTARTAMWVLQHYREGERESALLEAAKRAEAVNAPKIMPSHFKRKATAAEAEGRKNTKRISRLIRECDAQVKKYKGDDPQIRSKKRLLFAISGLLRGRRTLENVLKVLEEAPSLKR